MERTSSSNTFPIGSKLPTFALKNVDGRTVESNTLLGGKAALVVFTCNHCPYVKGSEAHLITIVRTYATKGLRTVAINANDAAKYPDDDFPNMQRKAKELDLPYPYLVDETQQVAKLFDAACTPECYLFDAAGLLVFHGTINDNPRDGALAKNGFLETAITQVLAGSKPSPAFVHPLGCSIKWK